MKRGAITFIFVCACSGKVLDVGSNQGGAGGASPSEPGGASANGAGGASPNGAGAGGASSAGSFPGGQAGATGGEVGGAGGGAGAAGDGLGIGGGIGGCNSGFACGTAIGAALAGAGGATIAPWPSDANCQSGVQLPIVGVWDGYVENLAFASGSDAVHVVITAANDTEVCGHVAWGQGAPPPSPTDPNVGYPPSFVDRARNGGAAALPGSDVPEGFPMTMLNGHATSARVQFQVAQRELWRAWCEMQTPYPAGSDFYMCIPNIGWTGAPMGCALSNGERIDCAKLGLCQSQLCACTASGCTVSPEGDVNFDLHVQSADKLTGSATLMGLHNVYLDRTR